MTKEQAVGEQAVAMPTALILENGRFVIQVIYAAWRNGRARNWRQRRVVVAPPNKILTGRRVAAEAFTGLLNP